MADYDYESAARHYCKLLGLDPDEKVLNPARASLALIPRWQKVIPVLREAHAAMIAIEAMEARKNFEDRRQDLSSVPIGPVVVTGGPDETT